MIDVDSQRVNGGDGSVDTNVKLPTKTQCVVVATPTVIIHPGDCQPAAKEERVCDKLLNKLSIHSKTHLCTTDRITYIYSRQYSTSQCTCVCQTAWTYYR